jgi:hypothetical protein
VIQSCNVSNQKSQTLKDENFVNFFSYSMMMEEFEYCNLLRKLNLKRLIFDDIILKNYIVIYQLFIFDKGC